MVPCPLATIAASDRLSTVDVHSSYTRFRYVSEQLTKETSGISIYSHLVLQGTSHPINPSDHVSETGPESSLDSPFVFLTRIYTTSGLTMLSYKRREEDEGR